MRVWNDEVEKCLDIAPYHALRKNALTVLHGSTYETKALNVIATLRREITNPVEGQVYIELKNIAGNSGKLISSSEKDSVSRALDTRYLQGFLSSKAVVNQTSCLMMGNTLPRLQTREVKNPLIPLPSVELQIVIADEISMRRKEVKRLCEVARAVLAAGKAERMTLGEKNL